MWEKIISNSLIKFKINDILRFAKAHTFIIDDIVREPFLIKVSSTVITENISYMVKFGYYKKEVSENSLLHEEWEYFNTEF